jgi:hypothetical protein
MKKEITIEGVYINDSSVLLNLRENGPWEEDVFDDNFARLQNRAYDCMSYALGGQMRRSHPETKGKMKLVIQFGCIDIPEEEIEYLAAEMNRNSQQDPMLQSTLKENEFISEISFQTIVKKSSEPIN